MNGTVEEKVESAVEETAEETVKKYELRPLVAADMGAICKIITAIGVRQFKECFNVDQIKEGNIEAIGFGVVFDIAGIIISNMPKAEEEIQSFASSLTGMKVSEIRKLPLADYGEIILATVTKEEFQDFFRRVMKLFNR